MCLDTVQLSNSSIWPTDRTLSGVTTPVQSGPGGNGNGQDPRWKSLTPLQRCSWCILQFQPTGPSLEESYPFAKMQLMYSTVPADRTLVGRVLPLCRDAVDVFYSPSRQDPRWRSLTPLQRCSWCILQSQPTGPSLEESYPFAKMQLMYSTVPADRTLVGGVLPLCSWCILQLQVTVLFVLTNMYLKCLHISAKVNKFHSFYMLSKFLRRSLLIFIIKVFWTIVFIIIVISTTFRPICPPAFFRCCRTREPSRNFELRPLLKPRGSPVLILLAITGYKC